jgi:hypothetical protein
MDHSINYPPTDPAFAGPWRVVAICSGIAAAAAVAVAGLFVLLPELDRARHAAGPLPALPDGAALVALASSPPRRVPAYVPPSAPPHLAPQALVDREGALAASAASLDVVASRLAGWRR